METELTEKEMIHYANYSLIDVCDKCGNESHILNYNDGNDFLTLTGKYLYCQDCLKTKTDNKRGIA